MPVTDVAQEAAEPPVAPGDACPAESRAFPTSRDLTVRLVPAGDSPYQCADMAGNVWEWTASCLRLYPFEDDERRGDPAGRVLRGGAFHQEAKRLLCSFRYWYYSCDRLNCCGFRVKASPGAAGPCAPALLVEEEHGRAAR